MLTGTHFVAYRTNHEGMLPAGSESMMYCTRVWSSSMRRSR